MNKKIIGAAAILAAALMSFAACGGNDEPAQETTVSTEIITEAVSEETAAEDENDVIEENTDINLDEVIPEDEIVEDGAAEDGAVSEGEVSANPLYPMVEQALSESEWPVMMEVTDATILNEFFLLDPTNANYKEMIVMQCPISAVMSEIIIINADDADSAKADLDARRTKAIEQDAWYPADKELADASIVGTNGSYVYFIIGSNAAAAETSINAYIDANA